MSFVGEQGPEWVRTARADRDPGNSHGWSDPVTMRTTEGPATVQFAAMIDETRRCACPSEICQRPATQEDWLCDECREKCPHAAPGLTPV